jgi:hypothetical protein
MASRELDLLKVHLDSDLDSDNFKNANERFDKAKSKFMSYKE